MAKQLEQATSNLKKVIEYVKCGTEAIPEYLSEVAELGDSEFLRDIGNEYKSLMKTYILMEQDTNAFTKAMEQVKSQVLLSGISEEAAFANLEKLHTENVKNEAAPEMHNAYVAMLQSLPGASKDVEMGEEDLVFQEETQTFKCPYTGKEMVDPMKNTNCGHSYDREGILEYIKQRGRNARCPMSGCPNKQPVTVKYLIPDKKLKRELEKRKKGAGK